MFKLVVLTVVIFSVSALKHPDEVAVLPGLNFPLNYNHYSGYLNATSGKFLHYWFVESQRSPSTDPLVLWMNGGPGCSSLDGFLTEHGPLRVSADGKTLYKNKFSWNRQANVIYLETPVGVGFSYALNKKYFGTDDDTTANDNYLALLHFFEKFPQFKTNEFYIAGESYGGIFVSTLSVKVLTEPAKINFKGFAIGNGVLDRSNLSNSIVFFAYYHGLVGRQLWTQLEKYCCGGIAAPQYCDFYGSPDFQCSDAIFTLGQRHNATGTRLTITTSYHYADFLLYHNGAYDHFDRSWVDEVYQIVHKSGLNMYNLNDDCIPSPETNSRYLVDKRNLPNLQKISNLHYDPACTDASALRKYLNQPCVRTALHIPSTVQYWEICSIDVEYGYNQLYNTVRPQILQLMRSGKVRGLIYNGDADMVCNFLGNEWFADGLGLKVLEKYKEWKYNNQVAGFVKYYDRLTFLTIKGSGHMVAQDDPGPAFKMISSFLSNEML